ncbi:MAG: hypothetical protein OXH16_01335 [Gemmatimonadetes bacterium]|nr:hypothetical protein [Gemmatimonadota bacterium]
MFRYKRLGVILFLLLSQNSFGDEFDDVLGKEENVFMFRHIFMSDNGKAFARDFLAKLDEKEAKSTREIFTQLVEIEKELEAMGHKGGFEKLLKTKKGERIFTAYIEREKRRSGIREARTIFDMIIAGAKFEILFSMHIKKMEMKKKK